jgi:protein-disulfide isomerase
MRTVKLRSCLLALASLALLGCPSRPPPVDPAVAEADAESAPCARWAESICLVTGSSSTLCTATDMVVEFLPESACRAALADLPATRTRLRELRGPCDELTRRTCSEMGEPSQSCTLMTGQVADFSPDKCRDLLEHFDEVIAQLRCFEASGRPLPPEQQAAMVAGNPPSFGPADARVTLILFSDFQCPYCKSAAAVVDQLRRRYADRSVRFVFRHYPLEFHEYAHLAAEASLEAQAQGKFWEFHDLVFANQEALDPILLEQLAGQAGLNLDAYRAALRDGTHVAAVDADMALGNANCVQGTPTLFLDFLAFRFDPRTPDELYQAIDTALGEEGSAGEGSAGSTESAAPPDPPAAPDGEDEEDGAAPGCGR